MKNCSNQPTYFLVLSLKQQSHSSVYVKRAPDVLKKMQNSTYARRTSEARPKRVTSTLGTLGVRPERVAVRRLKSSCVSCAFGIKKNKHA